MNDVQSTILNERFVFTFTTSIVKDDDETRASIYTIGVEKIWKAVIWY